MPSRKPSSPLSVKLLLLLSCAMMLLSVNGCETTSSHSDSFCVLYTVVTDVESNQTDENNATWLEVCHGEDLTAED